jgi:hypothetical protein
VPHYSLRLKNLFNVPICQYSHVKLAERVAEPFGAPDVYAQAAGGISEGSAGSAAGSTRIHVRLDTDGNRTCDRIWYRNETSGNCPSSTGGIPAAQRHQEDSSNADRYNNQDYKSRLVSLLSPGRRIMAAPCGRQAVSGALSGFGVRVRRVP